MPMPNGRHKGKARPADLRIDPREVEEEIRRNRAANERFMKEYSEWFETRSTKRGKRRGAA